MSGGGSALGGGIGGGPRTGRGGGGGTTDGGRLTWITWKEAVLGKPGEITPKAGEETESEAQQLRRMLHISDWDPRPTLLYFHRDHEDEAHKDSGKAWAKQCREINDETVARWAGLYVFVEVDMAKSDAEMLARFGAAEGPSFAVVDRDLGVRATSGALSSGKKLAAFLRSTVEKDFPEYWSQVQEQLDLQKQAFEEAKALERRKELDAALDKLREVTRSTVRVAPFCDDAVKAEADISKKLLDD